MTSIFHHITSLGWTADLDYGAPGPSARMRRADFADVASIEFKSAVYWGRLCRMRQANGETNRADVARMTRFDHLIAARAAFRIYRHGNHRSI